MTLENNKDLEDEIQFIPKQNTATSTPFEKLPEIAHDSNYDQYLLDKLQLKLLQDKKRNPKYMLV